jgi:predicted house-cleaning noncanonical NTP pyrophosphatase (MazG superfamily)
MRKIKEINHETKCVNSNWIARFLAGDGQECCQCGFECKVSVTVVFDQRHISTTSNLTHTYILTEKELTELKRRKATQGISEYKLDLIDELAQYLIMKDPEDWNKFCNLTLDEEYDRYHEIQLLQELSEYVRTKVVEALELVIDEIHSPGNEETGATEIINELIKNDYSK